jgi:hypothetical protein
MLVRHGIRPMRVAGQLIDEVFDVELRSIELSALGELTDEFELLLIQPGSTDRFS